MRTKEATEVIKSIGWKAYKDEVGDRGAYFILPDRIIDIIYDVQELFHRQKFRVILSVSTDEFSEACRKVQNDRERYSALIVARNWEGIYAPEIKEEHIHQASQQAIDWAKEQDLQQALLKHAALPTDAVGTGPALHLSALVLLEDIEKLKFYQTSFGAGNRLGFVPYITKDYIDRAVMLAEQKISQ